MPLFSRLHLATDRDQVAGREKGRTWQRRLIAEMMEMGFLFFLIFWQRHHLGPVNATGNRGLVEPIIAVQSGAERQTTMIRQ